MGNAYALYAKPDIIPHPLNESTFDPKIGFPDGRKERVMLASKEELESSKIPIQDRDYCAHLLLNYRACRADVWPMAYKCAHEKHEYLNCEYDDYILRMKEFEREKRLKIRSRVQNLE